MTSQQLLKYFESRLDHMIASMTEIVEIESPSLNVAGNKAVVAWIESELAKIGGDLSFEKKKADGFGEHIIIRAFSSDLTPTLLLGHTDTVHPVGAKNDNPTRIENGRLYGCGVFDMKANIVVMLEALRFCEVTKQRPERPINVLLSCDEEVGSPTGRLLVEREAANAERCFVFEPSFNGSVKTSRKGTAMYTLHAHGIPSHAGLEPEKGANAILELARHFEHLDALNEPELGTTVNVCTMKGGTTSNVIPEFAECEIDVRFSTMDEAKRVENAIRSIRAIDERVNIEITGEINRPPMERTNAVVALYEQARETAASFDYELGEKQVGGASDGNFVAALGVPVLDGLGITGDGAHTLHEYIDISDIVKRATLVTKMLCR